MTKWLRLSWFRWRLGVTPLPLLLVRLGVALAVLTASMTACGSNGSAATNPSAADAAKRLTALGVMDSSGAASVLKTADILHNGGVDEAVLKSEGLTVDQWEELKVDFCTYAWGASNDVASTLGVKQLYLIPNVIAANWVGAENGSDLEIYCSYSDTPGGANTSHEVELAVSTADHQQYSGRVAERYTEKLSNLTLTISSDDGTTLETAKLAPFAAVARQRLTVGTLPAAASASATPTDAAVAGGSGDRISWNTDGSMTKDSWIVTSSQGTSLWIPYDNTGGKPQNTTLVGADTRQLLPAARFTFPNGGGCFLSLHDIPNDQQAAATAGSLTYGCIPPGTYVRVTAIGSQNSENGTTARSDVRHYATLTVNSNDAWKGVCMVSGDASVYAVPRC